MTFIPCAIVPTYRHADALEDTLCRLIQFELPVIVVDDGNEGAVAERIQSICLAREGVELFTRPVNGGKGAAMLDGFRLALARGYTHALQIDADGQHEIAKVPELIACARENPTAIVTGAPTFDDTMPRVRRIGRWITHFWVMVNTLSVHFLDAMCGFRVYPLEPVSRMVDETKLSLRMGFDIEIVVRLIWAGVEVKTVPVRVIYPDGNHSNFSGRENIGISLMHARLFFGMLSRVPGMILRRGQGNDRRSSHWAHIGERGSALGLKFLASIYRLFGRHVCLVAMAPVILFFFLTGVEQRRGSRDYLQRIWRADVLAKKPSLFLSLRHFMAFGAAALDKLAAWTGNIPDGDIEDSFPDSLGEVRRSGRGAFFITAHFGNPEVIRAIGGLQKRARVNVLVHTIHAERFNALIASMEAGSRLRMIQVTEVGPDTAILLQTAIANGEIVVIVGDRIPVTGVKRVAWANFFGSPAPFPEGPHILASILKCPVYLLFCVRDGKRHKVFFEHFADRIELPRKQREAAIRQSVERYAARLEHYVRLAPLQWFNFFDFWHPAGLEKPPTISERGEVEWQT